MKLVSRDGFRGERAHQATGKGPQGQALYGRHAPGEVLRGGREEGARRVVGYPGLYRGGGLRDICPGTTAVFGGTKMIHTLTK